MQKIILVIFIALFTISLKAQNQVKQIKQDSLYAIWQDKTQTDSTRAFAYRDYIFKGFMYSKPDSAFILAEDLVTFGLDNNYQAATARGYSLQGTSFILKGDYSEALSYLNKSGEIWEEIGDKKSIAAHDGLIGVIMTYQGDYAGALKNYKKSLKSLKQIESPDMSKTLNNIGAIYYAQGDYLKAIDYYSQSLKIDEELKIKGKADARDFDMVSILFTDFKGFTKQSAKLSATELVNEINTCFVAFDAIMEKYGIEKINTIGDAYMAAGGLPVLTDGSTKNTVLAAFEMQDFIKERKTQMDSQGLPSFEMRTGINTGPVVAGIVGVKKFQYDIWGDTVNTASRMESNGEVGKVNISQSTYDLLKNDTDLVFESRGEVEAKGKGKIGMYFVERKSKKE
jgi:class 3 adenylate cyclase